MLTQTEQSKQLKASCLAYQQSIMDTNLMHIMNHARDIIAFTDVSISQMPKYMANAKWLRDLWAEKKVRDEKLERNGICRMTFVEFGDVPYPDYYELEDETEAVIRP